MYAIGTISSLIASQWLEWVKYLYKNSSNILTFITCWSHITWTHRKPLIRVLSVISCTITLNNDSLISFLPHHKVTAIKQRKHLTLLNNQLQLLWQFLYSNLQDLSTGSQGACLNVDWWNVNQWKLPSIGRMPNVDGQNADRVESRPGIMPHWTSKALHDTLSGHTWIRQSPRNGWWSASASECSVVLTAHLEQFCMSLFVLWFLLISYWV